MKSGKTLVQLAEELERQSETKKDFIASTSALEMTDTGAITLESDTTTNQFPVTDHAHSTLSRLK